MSERERSQNFIRERIEADRAAGRWQGRVATRFPPEPNGYPHIGHAKSICLNFGLARDYGGTCNLRFDDTNPTTEDEEYVRAIQRDVEWLGFTPTAVLHASDYFEQLHDYAVQLIRQGDAYVDSLDEEAIRVHRGSLGEPGKPSPFRDRSVAENLDLFARMRAGEFPDGAHVLRGRADLAASNMKMRDPLFYRIRHAAHYRRGTDWVIYPLYDFAHCLSDAIEGITHSICTLEFENNRELYDWILAKVGIPSPPEQTEFARLELGYTMMSKRKLLQLVRERHVNGWDDPRLPTLSGMRRRGYTPEALRAFCDMIGVAKANSVVDIQKLEHCLRDDLNHRAPRVLCVLRPLRVVLENFSASAATELDAPFWPHDVPREGTRPLPLGRDLFIEREDFMTTPEAGFKRLAPGRIVRLRHGPCIRCDSVETDPATGEPTLLRCTVFADGDPPEKVHGVIHWVDAARSVACEVRLYDRLFELEEPGAVDDVLQALNPDSLVTLTDARIEPAAAAMAPGAHVQFERHGYFCADAVDHRAGSKPVFNRVVELRDSRVKKAEPVAADPPAHHHRGEVPPPATAGKVRPPKRSAAEYRAEARARHPELEQHRLRFVAAGLDEGEADVLSGDADIAGLFTDALATGRDPKKLARWIANDVLRELKQRTVKELPFTGRAIGALVGLVDDGKITPQAAKEVFARLAAEGGEPAAIAESLGATGPAVDVGPIVASVLAANADKAAAYRGGKTTLMGFFVGQVMKQAGAKADPQEVRRILESQLG